MINPTCDRCHLELQDFGALALRRAPAKWPAPRVATMKEDSGMRMHSKCLLAGLPLALAATLVSTALAVDVRVTIRNLSPDSSVALPPFTLAAHNGSFDAFDVSSAARAGIEDVAELGDGANLSAEATAAPASAAIATAIATQGGFGPGIFRPGASGSVVLSLDPALHRYLTYGSMVVPSNDAFLGNDSPTVVELFDAGGN